MGESKNRPEELPLEGMVGEMVPKNSDLEKDFQIYSEDGVEKNLLDKIETDESKFLKRLELAKQVAAQEGIKLGAKVVFDSKKEGATPQQGTILIFQVGDSHSDLFSEDAIKAGNFNILIEFKKSKSGTIYADHVVFKDLVQKIKSGEVKISD